MSRCAAPRVLTRFPAPQGIADENAHARALKERQLAAEGGLGFGARGRDARAEQAAAIEASFAAVAQPPVHATNPSLRPVEVLPVLPDFERWADAFVHLQFDQDPLAEVPYAPRLPPAVKGAPTPVLPAAEAALRESVGRGAFTKSYVLGGGPDGAPPERFLVYFAPTEAEARRVASGAGPAEAAETEAEWVREYSYDTRDEAQLLVLFMGDGRASYVPVHKRVALRRRAARVRDGGGLDVPRPSRVTLRRRKRTDEEEAAASAAKRALTAPDVFPDDDDANARPPTPVEDVDDDDAAVAAPASAAVKHAIFGDSDEED